MLRLIGFGQIPLYYASDTYEYALRPNQNIKRFGRSYVINEHGMRSQFLSQGEWRILKFGDSVINGGVATDQSELASTLLNDYLALKKPGGRVIQVSAGSWGPDNAFAWLQTHGDFEAKAIILVFSSHDWHDDMAFQDIVGKVAFYPDQQPWSAWGDAMEWVWIRYLGGVDWSTIAATGQKSSNASHNPGWDAFIAYCNEKRIPLWVYHHPNRRECETQQWSDEGQELEAFLQSENVQHLSGLSIGLTPSDYRDEIHLSPSGQQKMADFLKPCIDQIVWHYESEP